jgi:hypothetical protein
MILTTSPFLASWACVRILLCIHQAAEVVLMKSMISPFLAFTRSAKVSLLSGGCSESGLQSLVLSFGQNSGSPIAKAPRAQGAQHGSPLGLLPVCVQQQGPPHVHAVAAE